MLWSYEYLGKLQYFTDLISSAIWGWFPLLTMIIVRENSEVVMKFTQMNMVTFTFSVDLGIFFEPFERLLIRDFKGHLIHPSGFASQTKGIQPNFQRHCPYPLVI